MRILGMPQGMVRPAEGDAVDGGRVAAEAQIEFVSERFRNDALAPPDAFSPEDFPPCHQWRGQASPAEVTPACL